MKSTHIHRPIAVATFLVSLWLLSASSVRAADVDATPGPDAKGRWALLIGVDDYNELGALRFACNDQRKLGEQLVQSGFPADQVLVLHDNAQQNKYRPFRENILRQLDLVLGMANKGDLVVVGFSGHGVQLNGKSYLCPIDARIDQLPETTIPLDGVYDRLVRSKASLKLLLVDACRSNILPVGRRGLSLRGAGSVEGESKPPEGILLLASCSPGQVSVEDERFGHGVFMHFLLEGLRGEAADDAGKVSLARLYDYAGLETKKYVARRFNDAQSPALRGDIEGPFEICMARPTIARAPFDNQAARKHQTAWARYLKIEPGVRNSLGMQMVLIPAGEFLMGSSESPGEIVQAFPSESPNIDMFEHERPQHPTRITRPFFLGRCEVTRAEFRQFVEATGYTTDAERGTRSNNPTGAASKDDHHNWRTAPHQGLTENHPVTHVSWNDARAFCQWLSKREGVVYRMATQAEWEYACRAGTTTRYWTGDDPESLAVGADVPDASHLRGKQPRDYEFEFFTGYDWLRVSCSPNQQFAFRVADEQGRQVWRWTDAGYTSSPGRPGVATVSILNAMDAASGGTLHLKVQSREMRVNAGRRLTVEPLNNNAGKAIRIDASDGFPDMAPVGMLRPNAFGLCDMHGNVWEWCNDPYDDRELYPDKLEIDPVGRSLSPTRYALRGGCWG